MVARPVADAAAYGTRWSGLGRSGTVTLEAAEVIRVRRQVVGTEWVLGHTRERLRSAFDELRHAAGVDGVVVDGAHAWLLADPDIFLLAGRYTLLEQSALDSFLPACIARA